MTKSKGDGYRTVRLRAGVVVRLKRLHARRMRLWRRHGMTFPLSGTVLAALELLSRELDKGMSGQPKETR